MENNGLEALGYDFTCFGGLGTSWVHFTQVWRYVVSSHGRNRKYGFGDYLTFGHLDPYGWTLKPR